MLCTAIPQCMGYGQYKGHDDQYMIHHGDKWQIAAMVMELAVLMAYLLKVCSYWTSILCSYFDVNYPIVIR